MAVGSLSTPVFLPPQTTAINDILAAPTDRYDTLTDTMTSPAKLPSLTALLNGFTDPAVLISRDYQILAANSAYRRHYALDPNGPHLPRCYEASHHFSRPCDEAGETCPLKTSLETGQPQRVLHLHFTSAGEEHVEVQTLPIRDEHGEVQYFLELLRQSQVARHPEAAQTLVGRSRAFNQMLGLIERVAPSDVTVLLLGESGTGKELVAKAIHDASQGANGPFVPVECSGLTESLFESELFGHEKGAFTGAHHRKIGLVESAHGGTLFLDEIGDIPLALQVKLLRLIETLTFRRVGSIEPRQAQFRLICATHRNLKQMVAEGRFREDLYYRISSFPIELPALRQRQGDIALLADNILGQLNRERQRQLSSNALQILQHYPFPGNIRELRNILERASLLADGPLLLPEHLPQECHQGGGQHGTSLSFGEEILSLKALEQRYLHWARAQHRGDQRSLAAKLGVGERTLYRKLQALGDTSP